MDHAEVQKNRAELLDELREVAHSVPESSLTTSDITALLIVMHRAAGRAKAQNIARRPRLSVVH